VELTEFHAKLLLIALMITCVGAGYVMFRFGVTLGD